MLEKNIDDIVAGNDYTYQVAVPGIPADQTVVKAWLTAADKVPDPTTVDDTGALFQKIVLPAYVPDQGQILDDGASANHTALLRFDMTPADTIMLMHLPEYLLVQDHYDIKIELSGGGLGTPIGGLISARGRITVSQS